MSASGPAPADYGQQIEQNKGLSSKVLGQADAAWGQPIAGGFLGQQAQQAWGQPLNNGAAAGQKASDALYSQATSRLDPQFARQQESMNAQLAAQGLDPTSQAAKSAQGQFGQQKSDAYNQASYSAAQLGGQEAQRMQGMDLQSRMAPLMAQQQMQGLDLQARMAPLQAYQGLLGGQMGLQGQQYQQGANNAQMQNEFWSGLLGGGMKAGGSVAAAMV